MARSLRGEAGTGLPPTRRSPQPYKQDQSHASHRHRNHCCRGHKRITGGVGGCMHSHKGLERGGTRRLLVGLLFVCRGHEGGRVCGHGGLRYRGVLGPQPHTPPQPLSSPPVPAPCRWSSPPAALSLRFALWKSLASQRRGRPEQRAAAQRSGRYPPRRLLSSPTLPRAHFASSSLMLLHE